MKTAEEILKKYEKFVSNIEWHIKTNKPEGKELAVCEEQIEMYKGFIEELKGLQSPSLSLSAKQEAREYAEKEFPILSDGTIAREKEKAVQDNLYKAVLYGYNLAGKASGGDGWIRVEDRLPTEHRRYLCLMFHINCYIEEVCLFEYSTKLWMFDRDYVKVSHWQPLPTPPVK